MSASARACVGDDLAGAHVGGQQEQLAENTNGAPLGDALDRGGEAHEPLEIGRAVDELQRGGLQLADAALKLLDALLDVA